MRWEVVYHRDKLNFELGLRLGSEKEGGGHLWKFFYTQVMNIIEGCYFTISVFEMRKTSAQRVEET